jgi:predicted lysophospholipase L1 biosynthesis ABC-type transport system permease subunit
VAGTKREAGLRVVGVAVFPATDDGLAIAEGAMVTMTTAHRLGFTAGQHILGVQLEPDGRAAVLRKVARLQQRPAGLPAPPAEVTKLRQVDRLPRVLAIVLAVLALLATGHALFVAVRRRGYELAVLRVLGFRPRQVASAVAWQGAAMVVAGAVIGIPLGIVVGRIAWGLTAHTIGVLSVYRLPVAALGLIVPASIVLSVLLAWLPARRAARLTPATILRSE